MGKKDIVKEWIKRADDDFTHAEKDLSHEVQFFSHLAFFLQQAAEKYLKAYIIAYDLSFEYTHDLLKLLETCKEHDKHFEKFKDACLFINPFYIDTRYPVHWPVGYRKEDIEEGLALLKPLRAYILSKISIFLPPKIDHNG